MIHPLAFARVDLNLQRLIDQKRREKFGEIRPLIHVEWQGEKWIAVGNELLHSPNWKAPLDFLADFIKRTLTPEWGNAEIAKPIADRHPVLQWYDTLCKLEQQQTPSENGIYAMVPNGAARAYLLLAYDLFTARQHESLPKTLLQRLRNKDQFQGARHELFVIATCIRAGYRIEFEDESDSTKKHAEFNAVHNRTGQRITVEAKSRHREGVLGYPGERKPDEEIRAGVGRVLKKALLKPSRNPFVIFIDLNLPPNSPHPATEEWFRDVADPGVTPHLNNDDGDPWNLLLLSNTPHHYAPDETEIKGGYVIGQFGKNPKVPAEHPEAIKAVFDAALKFGALPNTFEEMQ